MTMNIAIAVVERLKNVEKFTKNRLCFVLNLHLLVLLKPPAYTFISKKNRILWRIKLLYKILLVPNIIKYFQQFLAINIFCSAFHTSNSLQKPYNK